MSAPRLADLPPAARRIVLALIEAERAARQTKEEPAAVAMPAGSATGGTSNATPSS